MDTVMIVAHSMGGYVARLTALQYLNFGLEGQDLILRRAEPRPFNAIPHFNRIQNSDPAAQGRLLFQAGIMEEFTKHGRRAIHDRDFRSINLNQQVVEPHARTRREEMFYGGDAFALFIGECGAELYFGDVISARQNIGLRVKIRAPEANSCVHLSRFDHHARACTGVNANSRANDWGVQCGLILYSAQVYSPCSASINTRDHANLNTSIIAFCCSLPEKQSRPESGGST